MSNMEIYNRARVVPAGALRTISAGHLKGKSDINPMWRIEKLTEIFGPCGIGWKYVITNKQVLPGANGEMIAIVDAELYYKDGDRWSEAVPGTGGNMMVNMFKGSLQSDDDGFKKALTDAISVAAKALGVGADVYFERSETKYSSPDESAAQQIFDEQANLPKAAVEKLEPAPKCMQCGKDIKPVRCNGKVYTSEEIRQNSLKSYHSELCWECMKKYRDAGEN